MNRLRLTGRFFTILLLILGSFSGRGEPQAASNPARTLSITQGLMAGPFPSPLPAFNDSKTRIFGLNDLLQFDPVDIDALRPRKGQPFPWPNASSAAWTEVTAGEQGFEFAPDPAMPQSAYFAVYLDVLRYTQARLILRSNHLFQAYLDGKVVASKKTSEKSVPAAESQVKADLKLETGKHLLIVKCLTDPQAGPSFALQASLETADKFDPQPAATTSPEERMSLLRLLDGPKIAEVSVSPDGSLAAVSLKQSLPPSNDSESWIELYRTDDGRLLQTLRGGMSISSLEWAPAGRKFSYVVADKVGKSIWLVDLDAGTNAPILQKVKGLGSYAWAPDASFIVYSVTEDEEKDMEGVKRFQNLSDRQPGWRNRSYLYRLRLPAKGRQRLTVGDLSTDLGGISPDGRTLLVGRSIIDYKRRPFALSELVALDLETLAVRPVWKGRWLVAADWSPDGKSLLMRGGPSLFGEIGLNVPKGATANEYDVQAYLFDLATQKAEPLTRDFKPSIDSAAWSGKGDVIYFLTTDRAGSTIYQYSLSHKTFTLIPAGVEVVEQASFSRTKPIAGFVGNGPNDPPKAYLLDLARREARLLRNPGAEDFANVRFGRVEPWTFKNKRGVLIDGSIYYPPDFDPSKKYPLIVNYYGGTEPITLSFGGRYPKELYASQGYVVYVLQPSGATGYGQEFSALHVNDWGTIVADEIIQGVKEFLASHPFIDPRRVGSIGASYGGFMTMLLLTKTNIFGAAVAHAGISSISSYWGEGYWGYGYNAYSAAESYPWNRPDIYINQSPLFYADKITTPLLLLHGSADTNVPPGESIQLFTALKILGREVEHVQVLDQNHTIMTYNPRITWTKTILAWFDRWLKGQPEWWLDLYPVK